MHRVFYAYLVMLIVFTKQEGHNRFAVDLDSTINTARLPPKHDLMYIYTDHSQH